jgi:hypothetical protein
MSMDPNFQAAQAACNAMTPGRPWVLQMQNQLISFCGPGACDSNLSQMVQAPENWRYDRGLILIQSAPTLPAGGGAISVANTDGNDLLIPANTELTLLSTGVQNSTAAGEPITTSTPAPAGFGGSTPGTWWNKSISDTDLLKTGAPQDRPFWFIATGLAVATHDAFQRGGNAASAADPKVYSNWLSPASDGSGYVSRIAKAIQQDLALEMSFGATGCTYYLGLAYFYPAIGGADGPQFSRNGCNGSVPGYMPFNVALCLGPRDDTRQATLLLSITQPIVIKNDPANPTISGAGATLNLVNTAGDGTVYVEVAVVLFGYAVCAPDGYALGSVPNVQPGQAPSGWAR